MNRVRSPWLLLAVAALITACAQEDATTVERAEVAEKAEQAVEMKAEYVEKATAAAAGIADAYVAAYNDENAAGIAALFAPDGTIGPPGLVSLEQPSIADYYATRFATGGDFTLEVEQEGSIVAGKSVVTWGGFAASVLVEGAEAVVVTGRYGSVSKLQPDGSYKIYRHLFNYISPPPEM